MSGLARPGARSWRSRSKGAVRLTLRRQRRRVSYTAFSATNRLRHAACSSPRRPQIQPLAVTHAALLAPGQPSPRARAIVLAAGRGERLRPWTDHVPKPLLQVGKHRLIEWHLLALSRAGLTDVVINTAWLEEQFPEVLGDGSRYGLHIHWSFEQRDFGGALETAGGIARALPLLDDVFWVVSADTFVPGFAFLDADRQAFTATHELARLWLAPNAPHHPDGDFGLSSDGYVGRELRPRLTWSSIALFRSELLLTVAVGQRLPLRPLFDRAADSRRLGGSLLQSQWLDVGSPERWAQAQALASQP
jgi:N-acetyl-alpha-D-muramate 1-phosphate uridylyltransferase